MTSSAERSAPHPGIIRGGRVHEPGRTRATHRAVRAGTVAPALGPGPGAHEIVCHCADAETNAAARIRYLLAEEDPVIVGYNQDEWARKFDYHSHPLEPALLTLEAVRANTVPLLRRISGDMWAREGRHTESGRYTVADWLRIYGDHLESHTRQIERNLEAWEGAVRS
jgi:hypothetical protein